MIILDAGHGGDDSGARADRMVEKDVALVSAKIVEARLRHAAVKVRPTRDADWTVKLKDRVDLERRLAAETDQSGFVSIHANFFEDESVRGTRLYHFPFSKQGRRLAGDIAHRLSRWAGEGPYDDRIPFDGIRKTDREPDTDPTPYFYVLGETVSPAVLVELGFLSNPMDRECMRRWPPLQNMSVAIAEGIREWFQALGEPS